MFVIGPPFAGRPYMGVNLPPGIPAQNTDFFNPRLFWVGTRPDWIQQAVSSVVNPVVQTDWPNPTLGIVRRSDFQSIPFFGTSTPTSQLDWPNPTLGIVRRPDFQSLPFFGTSTPTKQTDWPNPTLAIVRRSDYQFSPFFGVSTPTAQRDWPNPVLGIVRRQDFQFSRSLETSNPTSQLDWPNPVLGIVRRPDFQSLPFFGTSTPTAQYDWPVPKGYPPRPDWIQQGLKILVAPPFYLTEWPNPTLAIQRRPDFSKVPFFGTSTPTSQLNWPNPTLGIPRYQDLTVPYSLPLNFVAPVVTGYYLGGMWGGFAQFSHHGHRLDPD